MIVLAYIFSRQVIRTLAFGLRLARTLSIVDARCEEAFGFSAPRLKIEIAILM